jgi:hypothetical protein
MVDASDVAWMAPYLQLSQKMMIKLVQAQVGGLLPTAEEMDGWRKELLALHHPDDGMEKMIAEATYGEQLLYVSGVITGRASKRRKDESEWQKRTGC